MQNGAKHYLFNITFLLWGILSCAVLPTAWAAKNEKKPKAGGEKSKNAEEESGWLILVEGQRRAKRIKLNNPSSLSVISKGEIEQEVRTLAEVLRDVAGLEVRTSGGPGAFSTLSLRGSSSEQVAIYLDGLPLNQALGGGVNLGDISLKNLERVEIYKSFIPPQFMETPVGGVVNLVSRRAKAGEGFSGKFSAQIGSYGHQKHSLESLISEKSYRVRVFGETENYKGDFSYFDNGGTPFNPVDDATRTRLNAGMNSREYLINGTRDMGPKSFLSFSAHRKEKDQGVPGFGVAQSVRSNLATEQTRLQMTLNRAGAFQKADLNFQLQSANQLSAFRDHASEIGLGPQDNKNETRLLRFQTGFQNMPLGKNRNLEGWLAVSQETWRPNDRLSPFRLGRPSERAQQVATVGYQQKLGAKWHLHTVSRLSRHLDKLRPDPTNLVSTRLNRNHKDTQLTQDVSLVFMAKKDQSFRFSVGSGQRLPNLFEIFGDRGSTIGNANLVPENSFKSELGWRKDWKKWSVDATIFDQNTKNLIVFEQTGQFVSRATNLNKTHGMGQEWGVEYFPNSRVGIKVSHTQQKVAQKGGLALGPLAPGIPKSLSTLKVDWSPRAHWTASYQLHRRGPLPQDTANFVVLPSQTRHSLRVGRQFGKSQLSLGVENLGNKKLQDIQGFPLPGRAWTLSFDQKF